MRDCDSAEDDTLPTNRDIVLDSDGFRNRKSLLPQGPRLLGLKLCLLRIETHVGTDAAVRADLDCACVCDGAISADVCVVANLDVVTVVAIEWRLDLHVLTNKAFAQFSLLWALHEMVRFAFENRTESLTAFMLSERVRVCCTLVEVVNQSFASMSLSLETGIHGIECHSVDHLALLIFFERERRCDRIVLQSCLRDIHTWIAVG